MSRLVHRLIEVETLPHGEPVFIRDGPNSYQVSVVLDSWAEMGEWWRGEGLRKVFRVLTEEQGLFDIECVEKKWFLYKVWD